MQALTALSQRVGAVVSREELILRCWGGRVVSDDAINRCIAKIRKLADVGAAFSVETIPRVGYVLRTEAAVAAASPANAEMDRTGMVRWLPWLIAAAGAVVVVLAGILFVMPGTTTLPASSARVAAIGVEDGTGPSKGTVFRDCASVCPEMGVMPTDYFMMGTSAVPVSSDVRKNATPKKNEMPQHEVLIGERFALSRYEVTREEYARFVAATSRADEPSCYTLTRNGTFIETLGASWRKPGFAQTPRDPAVCISWNDANAYAAWLSRLTSKAYRLPTEAEWEFAARTGATPAEATAKPCAAFNAADADYHARFPGDAHSEKGCADGFAATSPAGSFPASALGLFDMLGNAAQWTQDCYHPTYDNAPTNGSAWTSGDCTLRVVRGGYWALDAAQVSITVRDGGDPSSRYSANGFRVARSL